MASPWFIKIYSSCYPVVPVLYKNNYGSWFARISRLHYVHKTNLYVSLYLNKVINDRLNNKKNIQKFITLFSSFL